MKFLSDIAFYMLPVQILIVCTSAALSQPSYDNYELVWGDEFDVDGLPDSKNWGYEVGCSVRNKELQYYAQAREQNSRVEDGVLIIEARRETMNGCSYTSANLLSKKRDFKYGLFEIRAKIDIRQGSWPAWWWLPNSGGWPKGGEIDMMEFYKGNLLFNVMDGKQKWTSRTKAVSSLGSGWADEFHVWTWEWDSTKIDLWLDGTLMNHYLVANANGTGPNGENPFRRPGYMLINQAIGGNNGGDPSGTAFPVKYLVDYVRVYKAGKDTTAPKVISVTASTAGIITIVFSENVEKSSAEKLSAYTIGTAGVNLLTAKLQSDERSVLITTSGLSDGDTHQITINNINDRAAEPNTLFGVNREFTVAPESKKLTGSVIGNGNPYNGSSNVTYDKAVDGSSASFADCTGDLLWVGYDFGEKTTNIITGFRFYPRDGYSDRMSGKTFEISTDSKTWEKVYTIGSAPPEGSYTNVSIVNTKPVRYVRYNGTGGNLNACEVEFWGFSAVESPVISFNGKPVSIKKNGSMLLMPFNVSVYSLDGKRVFAWKCGSNDGPVVLQQVLDRAGGIRPSSDKMYLVSIEDIHQRKMWYRVINKSKL
ncbi:MAG: family 16 glycosylhydrolase [Chitinispirillaceae bacterium]|nr:family 16 glycosylhydrolase [Chitinispirillaceae bacterium]